MTDEQRALGRLQGAAMLIAAVLDGGERDPRWTEQQEAEAAMIEYGRLLNKQRKVKP